MLTFAKYAVKSFALAASITACSDDDNSGIDDQLSDKEEALQAATTPYINHAVLPIYGGMADAAIQLYDRCVDIRDKFAAGSLTEDDIRSAGEAWKTSRKNWELSEVFLFGPAAGHYIDPHIDSWPLDKAAMDALLADIRAGREWSIDNNGGYGLLGFHSIEYVLFQLSADGNTSFPHSPESYTAEELEYLVAVAEDLRNQCVYLEACWAGTEGLSDEKLAILEEADLGRIDNYGWQMINAGKPGSIFKTYQAVAEEIIQGCIDIADEVGNTKMGRPHSASSDEDRNYIESPYSLNSIEDFQDNIVSIRNSYVGAQDGVASISDYVASKNATLDAQVKADIQNAITEIGRIPEPFAKTATGAQTGVAIEACNKLVGTLELVMGVLSQQ